jgi:rhodanese-related sulfurtransferase
MNRLTIDELLAEARSRLERLEPAGALAAQEAGALLIDTRSTDERTQTGVIPGSIHIPLSVLHWRLDPAVDPTLHNRWIEGLDQQLVLVCAHGYSSSLAAATLQDLGFSRATDLTGGFTAWEEQGFPVRAGPAGPSHGRPGMGPPDS